MFILPCQKKHHKIGETLGNMVSIVRDATTNTFRHKSDVRVFDERNVALCLCACGDVVFESTSICHSKNNHLLEMCCIHTQIFSMPSNLIFLLGRNVI